MDDLADAAHVLARASAGDDGRTGGGVGRRGGTPPRAGLCCALAGRWEPVADADRQPAEDALDRRKVASGSEDFGAEFTDTLRPGRAGGGTAEANPRHCECLSGAG